MYDTKKIFQLLIFFFSFSSFSQTVVEGFVRDSLGAYLPYANIIAEPQDTISNIKFAVTGEEGQYSIPLKNGIYKVRASYLGYKTKSVQIEIRNKEIFDLNFLLQPEPEGLKEVVIDLPVTVKEDTIVYRVDKFITGEERKLKDILEKLPGVEVDRDGKIKVRGKEVTVMLVENKKFFGGGSQLAVENIPADAIDKIEVLDHYNEVAFLKDISDSEDLAINVKLKEDKKEFVFGDTEAGKGNKNFYRAHSNLFYYSSKTNINFIGNINNIREQILNYEEYFNFTGGLNPVFNQGRTVFNSAYNDFLQFLEGRDVDQSQRQFGAINITQEFSETLNVTAYGLFSKTKEGTVTKTLNTYNFFRERKNEFSDKGNLLGIGHFKAVYLPNLTDRWSFQSQFKRTNNEYESTLISVLENEDNNFQNEESIAESFFSQNIEWHRKSSSKHTFSFALDYTFEERKIGRQWQTSNANFEDWLPVIQQSQYNLRQSKVMKRINLDGIFKHYWIINKNNHVYSTAGATLLNQHYNTNNIQDLSSGDIYDLTNENFGNDLELSLSDSFIGLNYKFQSGIFSFNQGAFLHHYQWKTNQKINFHNKKTLLLPEISVGAKFSQTKELEFKYQLQSSFPNAVKLATGMDLFSYNSIFQGNDELENELSQSFELRFNKFSTYRGFRYYLVAQYVEEIRGLVNELIYRGTNQKITPILLHNPENQWNFYGRINKKIRKVDLSAGVRFNTSQYDLPVNNYLTENKRNNLSYNISGKSLFRNLPNIELGLRQNFGRYTLGGSTSTFVTTEPFLNVDYDFKNDFITSLEFVAHSYENKELNQKNKYEIANFSLFYNKENSPWSFEVKIQNLFDVSFKRSNYFSSYLITDTKTFILPRIIILSVGYKL